MRIEKYAAILILLLMSVFAVCLIADELGDVRRAVADLRVEACVEIETEDFEWDEEDEIQNLKNLSPVSPKGRSSLSLGEGWGEVLERGFISDDQRLGLVRRYAPRKGIAGYNYVLT